MDHLAAWFHRLFCSLSVPQTPCVVTIIGCGGKTSLLWHLAHGMDAAPPRDRRAKILVSTTTHMGRPAPSLYDRFWDTASATSAPDQVPAVPGLNCASPPPAAPGITLLGDTRRGSCGAPSGALLAALIPGYDYVFLEGDGSRQRPLKGWADYEPVVVEETTVTVGVLPLWPLGRPIGEDLVHRLPLFCALTGAAPGDPVSLTHLARLVAGDQGLFAKAQGVPVLFCNQAEDAPTREQAAALVSRLPAPRPWCIAGSVREQWCVTLARP